MDSADYKIRPRYMPFPIYPGRTCKKAGCRSVDMFRDFRLPLHPDGSMTGELGPSRRGDGRVLPLRLGAGGTYCARNGKSACVPSSAGGGIPCTMNVPEEVTHGTGSLRGQPCPRKLPAAAGGRSEYILNNRPSVRGDWTLGVGDPLAHPRFSNSRTDSYARRSCNRALAPYRRTCVSSAINPFDEIHLKVVGVLLHE